MPVMRGSSIRSRRGVVPSVCLLALALVTPALAGVGDPSVTSGSVAGPGPVTGFEERNGASWTSLEEEAQFLGEVDARSSRVRISTIGRSTEDRPLRLVQIAVPAPAASLRSGKQVALLLCSQHGNEPAGRETCMQWLRELAFTRSPALVDLLRSWTVLIVPTANPDGRVANTRENAQGTDINRDHLTLSSPETQAVARVIREWRPDTVLDLHEIPADNPAVNRATFDDDVYYLWPRNLNVDPQLYSLAKTLAADYVGVGSERAGYTADEYGKVDAADRDLLQIAGDHDEGISRNLAALRGAVSVLIESNATANPLIPGELVDSAAVNRRRVASQVQTVADLLRFLDTHGNLVVAATDGARRRYTEQGRERNVPVYFGGADNDAPEPHEIQDPPPCAYRLTTEQARQVGRSLDLLDIGARRQGDGVLVSLAQPSEPLIPLLLDKRAARHLVDAEPLMRC